MLKRAFLVLLAAALIAGEMFVAYGFLSGAAESASGVPSEAVYRLKHDGPAIVRQANGGQTQNTVNLAAGSFVGLRGEAASNGWLHVSGADWDGWVPVDNLDGPTMQQPGEVALARRPRQSQSGGQGTRLR